MTQAIHLPESWYEATAQRDAAMSLEKNIAVECCVVGGGLAGLTTALALARAGKTVVLLEAGRIACGASGRNGGFVSNGFARGIGEIAALLGLDAARKLYHLSAEGTAFVRATIAAYDPSIRMGDGMRVCVRHSDGGGLHGYGKTLARDFGEKVDFSDVDATREKLASQRYFDSITFPDAFHIHPLRYALLLQRLAGEAGAQVFEQSRVQAVEKHADTFVISTAKAKVTCQHVVHCVSALDRVLHRETGRALLPVATYVAVTAPLQQQAIRTREAISDTRRAGDYYRLLPDDRILWGGRITTRTVPPRRLAKAMRADMLSVYPQLSSARMDYAWDGIMGYALHKMPLIGRSADGQWYATAFGGHGLNTTAMGGLLIARAITGADDSYRCFEPFAPRYAFGPLGRVGVQTSYWWMQARDRWDEARGRTPAA